MRRDASHVSSVHWSGETGSHDKEAISKNSNSRHKKSIIQHLKKEQKQKK